MTISPKDNFPDEPAAQATTEGNLPLNLSSTSPSVEAAADSSRPDGDVVVAHEGSSIFKNKYFMLLWVSQAITQTAQNTINLVLVSYVAKLSNNSPLMTAIVTACFLLPGVIFSAVAGVFVDRVKKRIMLFITNISRAIIVPCMALMSLINDSGLTALALISTFVLTLLFSSVSQFFSPAEAAAIPLYVRREQLARANSLFQVTLFAALFLGIAILGPLLPTYLGAENIFWAIGALYLICSVLVWFLPHDEVIDMEEQQSIKEAVRSLTKDLLEAWRYIRADRQIWMAIVYASIVQTTLFFMIALGLPYITGKANLNQPQSILIFVLAPLSVGLGIAVALITRLIKPQIRSKAMLWANVVIGAGVISVGMIKPLADLVIYFFMPGTIIGGLPLNLTLISLSLPFGFAIGIVNIQALTIMQERSDKDMVGRVFAAYFTFANAISIIPIVFGGALGDLVGIVPIFVMYGAFVISVSYYAHHDHQRHPEKYV